MFVQEIQEDYFSDFFLSKLHNFRREIVREEREKEKIKYKKLQNILL